MPPWLAPPGGTVPGVVALELVLARSEAVAVFVSRVDAYPSGFALELMVMSELADDALDPLLFGPRRLRGLGRGPGSADKSLPEEKLRFGVQFADGTKATNTQEGVREPFQEPAPPVLHTSGGGGGSGRWYQSLWIWPLPPPGPLWLVCEWPSAKIALTRHEIDAQQILDAASRAQVIFSEEHLPLPEPRPRPGPPPQPGAGGGWVA
jgi:hypothetical protein